MDNYEKKYKDALEWARKVMQGKIGFVLDEVLEKFPELKESEDEMMIQYFKDLAPFDKADELYEKYGFSHKDAIAWLEKQGEHANFRNKIQIGDKVTRNEDGVLVNLSQLNRVAKKQTEQKLYVNDNAKEMFIKALERVEEQNNKGYKLTDCDKNSWWEDFKNYTSCTIEQNPAWSEEDEEIYRRCICSMRASACGFPEEEKFVEQVNNWFNSLKDKVQPKQEWSEEDENRINNLCHFLEEYGTQYYGYLTLQDTISWLKSLKDKYAWKPSDEQLYWLKWVAHGLPDTEKANEAESVLEELLEQLKKLRENRI